MIELHKTKPQLDLSNMQLCAISQLALVMGDKAKPGDHVQHEGWVSEITVTYEPYTSSASHTHIYGYQYKGPAIGPVRWVSLQKEGSQLP